VNYNQISQVNQDSDRDSGKYLPRVEVEPPAHKTAYDHLRSLDFYKVAGVYMGTRLFTNLSQVM